MQSVMRVLPQIRGSKVHVGEAELIEYNSYDLLRRHEGRQQPGPVDRLYEARVENEKPSHLGHPARIRRFKKLLVARELVIKALVELINPFGII